MSNYFKNTELAELYGISEATVRNWLKASKQDAHGLELVERNGRVHVAKSISNISIVEKLVRENRKYRNALASRTIIADQKLFEVFDEARVYDIVRSMELHGEVPHQYTYFEEGVPLWEESANEQLSVERPSMLRRTIELIESNYGYIDSLTTKYKKVNIIDIGVGNAAPVKGLLTKLIQQNRLGRYIAIDFSKGMLDLARGHLEEWFGGTIQYEEYVLDMAYDRFANLLSRDYLNPDHDAVNLVLLLGATPNNLRVTSDAFRTIYESINGDDLFIYTDKLEPPNAPPEWFEHGSKNMKTKPDIAKWHKIVFDLIGIDEALYDFEVGFDKRLNQRYARARFKVATTLVFNFSTGSRSLSLEKGDAIVLWRCLQTTQRSLLDLLESAGFYVMHTSQSEDHNYILTVAKVH